MFETAEIGNAVDKAAYKLEVPKLREALINAQKELAAAPVSVVIIMSGVEGAGKTETVNKLLEWLDARGVQVHALGDSSDEERERPPYWRIWRLLPPSGRLAFLIGSWYTQPIVDRAFERLDASAFDEALDRVVAFERMLSHEGTRVLKLWLHLSKEAQQRRLKELEDDPRTAWRVTQQDWKFAKRYDAFRRVSETALRKTDTAEAPWHIVEATDPHYRQLTVARVLLETLRSGIAQAKEELR
ncbi:MAG: hypothetical protein HYY16_10680 [Planctomycetes bacterium]|nr:hypothetical protein [Planctomycetota bacterium]